MYTCPPTHTPSKFLAPDWDMVDIGNLFAELTTLHSLGGVGQQIPVPNTDITK